MLTVEKIDTLQGFQALQPVWDELLESSQTRNIFLTYKWFHVWWSTFSDHNELYVLTVRRDQKIIGIAPLMLLCDSGKKTLQFIAANYSDLADFIIAEDHESVIDEIVTYLDGHRREWNSINLSQIAEQSRTARILTSRVAEADFRYLTDATDTCASHVYQGKEEERPDFSVKKSKTLRNQINFFRKSGGLSLNIIENIDDTLRLLPTFFHYHITRWNNTTTPSKFVKPENRQFYVNLLKAFHPTDNIRFLALMNGSIPIAFFFAFHLDKVLYLYTPSYNVYHTKRSPVIILNNLLIESLIRH
jgi:CelD/BcsL family acetyltransferase involved in cellulose biosynthesis